MRLLQSSVANEKSGETPRAASRIRPSSLSHRTSRSLAVDGSTGTRGPEQAC